MAKTKAKPKWNPKAVRELIDRAKAGGLVATDAEFAVLVGVSKFLVSNWCGGRRTPQPLAVRRLEEIAAGLA